MEKPIHVKVAEALGQYIEWYEFGDIRCWRGAHDGVGGSAPIPRYDRDWSATGPLVEKYGLVVFQLNDDGPDAWVASEDLPVVAYAPPGNLDCRLIVDGDVESPAYGPTPLLAICNLILALKTVDKLKALHG